MHSPEFRERVAIVTGAGKGIGQATAIAFGSLGARVVLSRQTEQPLTETLGLIEKAGGTAVIVLGDVATERAAQDTVATALCTFGRLDFAVNNAGVSPWTGNTVECTVEMWQRVIGVNLTGTWLGMKHQIPAMLKNGGRRNR
jgi:NAD(P)-dependent dehydrogenase (short-subunit alcohol dehydrogenase family)